MPFGRSIQNVVPAVQAAVRGPVGRLTKLAEQAKNNPPQSVVGAAAPSLNRVAGIGSRFRFKDGGTVSSGRGDGIAVRGKTKCKMY